MDQAGSGKTLAYLLPMIQLLKAEERERAAVAITEDKAESDAARERPSAGPPLSAGSPGHALPRGIARPGAPRLIVAAPTIGASILLLRRQCHCYR